MFVRISVIAWWMLVCVDVIICTGSTANKSLIDISGPHPAALTLTTAVCNQVELSGTEDHQAIEGVYNYNSHGCYLNRNIYYSSPSGTYLYYVALPSSAGWFFGEYPCDSESYIGCESAAEFPERVTAIWQEPRNDEWIYRATIDVSCYNAGEQLKSWSFMMVLLLGCIMTM